MPRLAWPSWRWITFSETPARAISTAWGWRSWCGAKRRLTPALPARRRNCVRTEGADHGSPAVGPRRTQRSGPTGSPARSSSQGRSRCQPHSSMPASRRRPPLPRRTRIAPRPGLEIPLGERQRLRDPQSGPPEHRDQGARANAGRPLAGLAHHRPDLLHAGRVGGITAPLVPGRSARQVFREGRRRPPPACDVQGVLHGSPPWVLRGLACSRSPASVHSSLGEEARRDLLLEQHAPPVAAIDARRGGLQDAFLAFIEKADPVAANGSTRIEGTRGPVEDRAGGVRQGRSQTERRPWTARGGVSVAACQRPPRAPVDGFVDFVPSRVPSALPKRPFAGTFPRPGRSRKPLGALGSLVGSNLTPPPEKPRFGSLKPNPEARLSLQSP